MKSNDLTLLSMNCRRAIALHGEAGKRAKSEIEFDFQLALREDPLSDQSTFKIN